MVATPTDVELEAGGEAGKAGEADSVDDDAPRRSSDARFIFKRNSSGGGLGM
jgi:hypothetical protein